MFASLSRVFRICGFLLPLLLLSLLPACNFGFGGMGLNNPGGLSGSETQNMSSLARGPSYVPRPYDQIAPFVGQECAEWGLNAVNLLGDSFWNKANLEFAGEGFAFFSALGFQDYVYGAKKYGLIAYTPSWGTGVEMGPFDQTVNTPDGPITVVDASFWWGFFALGQSVLPLAWDEQ
jgi:hypothetical protein